MNLVCDTNALWHQPFVQALAGARAAMSVGSERLEVIVPAIAYAERCRQVHGDGPREEAWGELLYRVEPTIEAFGVEEAHRLAQRQPRRAPWTSHARDFLIAAHAREGRVVVTDDQGPAWEGIDVLTPAQATELVEALVG